MVPAQEQNKASSVTQTETMMKLPVFRRIFSNNCEINLMNYPGLRISDSSPHVTEDSPLSFSSDLFAEVTCLLTDDSLFAKW